MHFRVVFFKLRALGAGKCLQLDRPKIGMIKEFERAPDWARYGEDAKSTTVVRTYFEASEAAGGYLTQPL